MHERVGHIFAERKNELPILLLSLFFSDSLQCNFLFPDVYKQHCHERYF